MLDGAAAGGASGIAWRADGGTIDLLTGKPQSTPYIQRCSTVTSTAYWDVTYDFNGVTHHAQLSTPPGNTITVNGFGDPRM